ncbi:MAG: hypothetical protein CVV05_00615 [Gammaproteobacteria bacterium HGW-Gammaproteobacteria-1]|nr:MAG: hypothetical protein CVV05_00615 [Gammaproteobacteria bacterium HGW-Gammaproteobacteria-1]
MTPKIVIEESANGLVDFFIPDDRPVCGADVNFFREHFNLTVDEARIILGIPTTEWYVMMNQPDMPIPNASVALLLRYFAACPEDIPTIPKADITGVAEALEGVAQRAWGLLLGREAASGHRWVTKSPDLGPSTRRLAYYLVKKLTKSPAGGLRWWRRHVVDMEASARGIEDLLGRGSWSGACEVASSQKKQRAIKKRVTGKKRS